MDVEIHLVVENQPVLLEAATEPGRKPEIIYRTRPRVRSSLLVQDTLSDTKGHGEKEHRGDAGVPPQSHASPSHWIPYPPQAPQVKPKAPSTHPSIYPRVTNRPTLALKNENVNHGRM